MKSIIAISLLIMTSCECWAQSSDPVKWQYSVEKRGNKVYDVLITAYIEKGWHIYAQNQPEHAIAQPTTIKFTRNPLIKFSGGPKEIGVLEKKVEPILEVEQFQYSEKVQFIQTIQVKANVRTQLTGTITFMACTNEKCLPEKRIPFQVAIQN